MSFNTTSTLLCVSSSTETVHVFKLSHPGPSSEGSLSSTSPTARDRAFDQSSPSPEADEMAGEMGTSDLSGRRHNGTLMGMIRRTSQNFGTTVASKVGGYLPKGVSEMWEPARDFAWIRLPKPNQGPGGNGNAGPLRSVVAMSSNTPQVMVVTSDGNFYVFNIDLSKGGEGTLTKQYSYATGIPIVEGRANNIHRVLDANDRLGYSGIDY
jgi:autophagy-related protein 18